MEGDKKRFSEDFVKLNRNVGGTDRLMIEDATNGQEKYIDVDGLLQSTIKTTGNQIIAGTKKFNNHPEVPDPELAKHAATKKYVDENRSTIVIDGEEALAELDEVFGQLIADVVYKVDIISSNGNVFKNNLIDTELRAVVYRGRNEVTDTLNDNAFRWTRKSDNLAEDALWNEEHFGGTKVITVTSTDVDHRATFQCDVQLDVLSL